MSNMQRQHAYSVSDDAQASSSTKNHNACDECRARKLKCSGELNGCTRCRTDRVACRYSPRKQMGRPRKKRNDEGMPPQSYNSWSTDSSSSAMDPTIAQPDNSLGFPSLTSTNPQESTFPMIGNTSMDYGYGNMMEYLEQPTTQANLGDTSFANTDLNIDFSTLNFSAANSPAQPAAYSSAPEYAFPSTSGGHLSPLPTPALPPTPGLPTTPGLSTTPLPPASPSSPPCQCPSTLYKTLQAITTNASNPAFPMSLQPLRLGTTTARTLLLCRACPQTYASALQNSMGSVTLLQLLIHTYGKLLLHIDARARSSPKIRSRFGDAVAPSSQHLHGGDMSCAMGVEIDLTGAEWRNLARKTVKKEIMGDEDDSDEEDDDDDESEFDCLVGVLQGLRKRQRVWHNSRRFERDVQHQHLDGGEGVKEGCICAQQVHLEQLMRTVMGFGL